MVVLKLACLVGAGVGFHPRAEPLRLLEKRKPGAALCNCKDIGCLEGNRTPSHRPWPGTLDQPAKIAIDDVILGTASAAEDESGNAEISC